VDVEDNQFETAGAHRAEPVGEATYDADAVEVVPAEVVADDTDAPELAEPVAQAAPSGDRLSAEQLCDYLSRASFPTVLGRRGYQQDEVDAFLVRLADSVRHEEPLRDLVRRTRFSTVRLEDGYDPHQVDEFLAAVVDLDPNAAAVEPEPVRNGLLSKLFG